MANFAECQTAKLLKRPKGLLFSTNASFYRVFLKLFGIFEIVEYCLVVMMIVTRISPVWKTSTRTKKAATYFRIFIVVVDGQGNNFNSFTSSSALTDEEVRPVHSENL